uniref:TLDc domain-containing protein n=1 Tax=Romanomermis culicivorax TaxID=13658 RepID=A0A915I239_ROMCU
MLTFNRTIIFQRSVDSQSLKIFHVDEIFSDFWIMIFQQRKSGKILDGFGCKNDVIFTVDGFNFESGSLAIGGHRPDNFWQKFPNDPVEGDFVAENRSVACYEITPAFLKSFEIIKPRTDPQ